MWAGGALAASGTYVCQDGADVVVHDLVVVALIVLPPGGGGVEGGGFVRRVRCLPSGSCSCVCPLELKRFPHVAICCFARESMPFGAAIVCMLKDEGYTIFCVWNRARFCLYPA